MRLHHEVVGAGEPLVILHGLFGSLENWRSAARELGRRYRVFSLDLRNHGYSPHSDRFDYPAMAQDVNEFAEQQGLETLHLLGHSMGGKVAMTVALTWPELVRKLVVVDMAPKAYDPQHYGIVEALQALHPERFSERRDADRALAARIPDGATRLFLLKNLVADDTGRLGWRIDLSAIARNYGELVQGVFSHSRFDGPTLFVKGERSHYIEQDDMALIGRIFPAARLETVAQAGHWVHAENLEDFLKVVVGFLEK